jgi:hypothetical protein
MDKASFYYYFSLGALAYGLMIGGPTLHSDALRDPQWSTGRSHPIGCSSTDSRGKIFSGLSLQLSGEEKCSERRELTDSQS